MWGGGGGLIKRLTNNQGEKALYTNLCSGISSSTFKMTRLRICTLSPEHSLSSVRRTHGTVLSSLMLKLKKNYLLKKILGCFSIVKFVFINCLLHL